MNRVSNHREMAQLLCSESGETEVRIALADLQRMTEVAQMTLRDEFAKAAMQGLLACSHIHDIGDRFMPEVFAASADWSYQLADAMIKERNEA